jgi:hypothetical protein
MTSSPSLFARLVGPLCERTYAELAAYYGAGYMRFTTIGIGVMAAGLWFAAGSIAAIYFADVPLLQGTHIVGEVLKLDVRPYIPTHTNRMKYETAVTYSFTAPDGRRFTSFTRRSLVSPPGLQRGGLVDVLYEPDNPGHSTMSEEFESDLGQKPFGAWLFAALGLLMSFWFALYVYRYMRWRCKAHAFDA